VEKLPHAWRDLKNYLKHKCKELKLKDLIVRLRIKEDNRKSKKRSNKNYYESKANVIKDSKGKTSTFKSLKRKKTAQGYKGKDQESKNKRFKETCYICNNEGHKANECRSHPKKNKKDHPPANLIDHSSPSLLVMVSKVNLTTNKKDWWVGTGATRHIYSEKLLFSDYQKLAHDEQLFIGNSAVSKVEEKEKVILENHLEGGWIGDNANQCTI